MWTGYVFCSYGWWHLLDHGLGIDQRSIWSCNDPLKTTCLTSRLALPSVAAHSWWHTTRIFEVFAECPTCFEENQPRSKSWGCGCSIEGCASLDPELLSFEFIWSILINMNVLNCQSACDYHLPTNSWIHWSDVSTQGEMTNQKPQNWRNLWACRIWTA